MSRSLLTRFCNLGTKPNGWAHYNYARLLSVLTSDEAGKRAEELSLASLSNEENPSDISISTLLAHAGIENEPNAPMSPPLHLATTHTRPADGLYLETDSKYGRMDNSTRLLLEKTVHQLECVGTGATGAASFAFSSGMMAVTALVLAHNGPITMIIPDDIYHGVPSVLHNVFHRHNVRIKQVDMSQESELIGTIKGMGADDDVIVWIETPSNPMCKIFNIRAICGAVDSLRSERSDITTVVDATMVSPVITRPIEVRKGRDSVSLRSIIFTNHLPLVSFTL
jgi:cystathionine gamma-synthase